MVLYWTIDVRTHASAAADGGPESGERRTHRPLTVSREVMKMPVLEVRATTSLEQASSAALDRQLAAERTMVHEIIRSFVVALPVCVAVLIAMMAIAMSDTQRWPAWTGLGAVIGVYVAAFFGVFIGVMRTSHLLDVVDEEAGHVDDAAQLMDSPEAERESGG
jgi:hypothetical protein